MKKRKKGSVFSRDDLRRFAGADVARYAEALGLKNHEAEERLSEMAERMAKDPELFLAWQEVTKKLGENGMVTDVSRKADSEIEVKVVPTVAGVTRIPEKLGAWFMRHAQDAMRKSIAEFEIERSMGRRAVTSLSLVRSLERNPPPGRLKSDKAP
jgi:hypothetical protein